MSSIYSVSPPKTERRPPRRRKTAACMSAASPRHYVKEAPDFDDETTKIDIKFRLLLEINELKQEINGCKAFLDDQTEQIQANKLKKARYQSKYCPDQMQQEKDAEDIPGKVLTLQAEVDELDQQITFFRSMFSEENKKKIDLELENQKQDILMSKNLLQNIDFETELMLSSNEFNESNKRRHFVDVMNETKAMYRKELKTLKKDQLRLIVEKNEVMKHECANDANKNELARFQKKYERLKSQREKKVIESQQSDQIYQTKKRIVSEFTPRKTKSNKTLRDSMHNENKIPKHDDETNEDSTIFHVTQNKAYVKDQI